MSPSYLLLCTGTEHTNASRELVTKTYKPPQVVDMQEMLPVIEKYMSDFRRVYVEHPRIRLDGVYIATCHYMYEFIPALLHLSDGKIAAQA